MLGSIRCPELLWPEVTRILTSCHCKLMARRHMVSTVSKLQCDSSRQPEPKCDIQQKV